MRQPLLALAIAAAPVAAPAQIAADACRAVLDELDAAFTRGDAEGYLRLFRPEHPFLHRVHAAAVRQRLAAGRLSRASTLQGDPRLVGDHTVVTVRATTRRADAVAAPPLVEWAYLVLRETARGPVPTLCVDVAPGEPDCHEGVFECPACNYRIGGAPGWLLVPIATARSGAVEACTFVLLGSDVALEVAVHAADEPMPAAQVVAALAGSLLRRPGAAAAAPWLPPSLHGRTLRAFSAARAEADLPGGERVVVHATALGALQHVLLLRGDAAQLRERAADVDALLATYRLLQEDADLAHQAATALTLHGGGRLQGGRYENTRHDVVATAPPGWSGAMRAGGEAFRIVWRCPERRGRLTVAGYRPPAGLPRWTPELVDRWLAELGPCAGLTPPAASDTGFGEPDATGQRERWLAFAAGAGDDAATANGSRHVRLLLRDDLLVVVDGCSPVGEDRLREAMQHVGRCR